MSLLTFQGTPTLRCWQPTFGTVLHGMINRRRAELLWKLCLVLLRHGKLLGIASMERLRKVIYKNKKIVCEQAMSNFWKRKNFMFNTRTCEFPHCVFWSSFPKFFQKKLFFVVLHCPYYQTKNFNDHTPMFYPPFDGWRLNFINFRSAGALVEACKKISKIISEKLDPNTQYVNFTDIS